MHGLASLVNYVATKRYRHEWFLWYLGRPVIGGVIALMFYVIIRGGLLSINAQPAGRQTRRIPLKGPVRLAGEPVAPLKRRTDRFG